MTELKRCESCIHAKPFGGSNDNRCGAWECEYINRAEAIKIWRANKDIVQCKDCIWIGGYLIGRSNRK